VESSSDNNAGPTVDAGADDQVYGDGLSSGKLQLKGSVEDDGLPNPLGK
jgi:hypothetical protein